MKKTLEKPIQLTSKRDILTLESKCFPLLSTGIYAMQLKEKSFWGKTRNTPVWSGEIISSTYIKILLARHSSTNSQMTHSNKRKTDTLIPL